MKAARVRTLGEVPSWAQVDEPVPTPDTEVAGVLAAPLKNLDRGLVAGSHYGSARLALPLVPGTDGVVQLADGRRGYVTAHGQSGLMAEQTLVDPRHLIPLPDGVDPVLAAAMVNPGLSAWLALEYAGQLQAGQSVLVLGATGVTGSLAVQLAKHQFGADRVIAAGRSHERLTELHRNGADAVIDLTAEELVDRIGALHAERPFDVVIDFLWGRPAEQALQALANTDLSAVRHRTRFVQIGDLAGAAISLPGGVLRGAGIELVGQGGGSIPAEAIDRMATAILPALWSRGSAGELAIRVASRPLTDVAEAWNDVEAGTRTVFVP